MFRVYKSLPSLQRKLVVLVFASGIVSLIYLLHTSNSERHHDLQTVHKKSTGLLDKLIQAVKSTPEPPTTLLPTDKPRTSPSTLLVVTHKEDDKKVPEPNKVIATGGDPYAGPQNEKQKALVNAFMHAWNGYKKFAWGHDELKPISGRWQEWFGVGLTIIDSLDTMWIMGLKDEFALGRSWVAQNLTFERDGDIQLFEITIRALGGLLSAYHLSGDNIFKDKALELGIKLYPCFNGPTKIPCNRINMKQKRPNFIEISTAESGTIQLEFRDLARSTNEDKYEKAKKKKVPTATLR